MLKGIAALLFLFVEMQFNSVVVLNEERRVLSLSRAPWLRHLFFNEQTEAATNCDGFSRVGDSDQPTSFVWAAPRTNYSDAISK